MVKKRCHHPHISDFLNKLKNSISFSKLDLRSGCHQMRTFEGDIWKIGFKTKQGLFKWLVMSFDYYNAPLTLMWVMNDVF